MTISTPSTASEHILPLVEPDHDRRRCFLGLIAGDQIPVKQWLYPRDPERSG